MFYAQRSQSELLYGTIVPWAVSSCEERPVTMPGIMGNHWRDLKRSMLIQLDLLAVILLYHVLALCLRTFIIIRVVDETDYLEDR